MGKGGQQTVSTQVDSRTQQYVDAMRRSAQGAQNNPIYAQGRQAGQLGLSALTGDPAALQQLTAGYGSMLDPYWNQLRQQTLSTIGDQATMAGAYGGGRQGVAEGQGLADIAIGQAGQRYGEYNSALGRAGQLAGLGLNIDPALQQMLAGSVGPYGQTQTTQTSSDPFSQALGIASFAAPFFFPPAAAATGMYAPMAAGFGNAPRHPPNPWAQY